MLSKIFGSSTKLYPQFRHLDRHAMLPSLSSGLVSNIYYTPKVQKILYTDQLIKVLSYLTRKKTVYPDDLRKLTQNILTQFKYVYNKAGVQNQQYGFQKNYKIQQQGISPYHGMVDYMVYLNKKHFFPLMFFQNQINYYCGAGLALSNMVMKAKIRQQPKTSGYSLITNGQQWVMFKVFRDLTLERSIIYQAKNNKFRNIYQDYEMVSVILGLIDYSLDIQRPDVETLKLAYDFIDEQRFQIQAKQGQQIKHSKVSKVLLKYYKDKKDWNSK